MVHVIGQRAPMAGLVARYPTVQDHFEPLLSQLTNHQVLVGQPITAATAKSGSQGRISIRPIPGEQAITASDRCLDLRTLFGGLTSTSYGGRKCPYSKGIMMAELSLDPDLVFRGLSASSTDELFDILGSAAHLAGFAAPTYPQALKDRERDNPTGLPVCGGVAIPHTDPQHVLRNTIVVATLSEPVAFGEMGGADGATVAISTVFLLAITAGEFHLEVLAELIGCIQDQTFIDAIHGAESAEAVVAILGSKLTYR